ncbi:O-antigen ligase family protein [Patescibacteria group bacterium]|nr:O-antigen ligase family protein [Patescibacteria group bacterium]
MRSKINQRIHIEQIILFLFLFITPYFGKTLDYTESIIFYSLPPLVFFSLLLKKTSKTQANAQSPEGGNVILNLIQNPFKTFTYILIPLYLISAIFSQNIGTSYYAFFTFLTVLLTLTLSLKLIPPKKFNFLLITSSLFYSLIFILHKLNIVYLDYKPLGDNFILQIWGHSYLADLIVLSIPILINYLQRKNTKKTNIIILILLLIIFPTLLLTQSRSAILALFIGLLFLKPTNKKNKRMHSPPLAEIAKISILSILAIFSIIYSILIFQNKIPKKDITGSRLVYWQQAISAFIDKPLFGNGPNTFSYINKKYQKTPNSNTNLAHSSFFTYLSENGIFFTLLFFYLIIKQLISKTKQQRSHPQGETNNLYFCLGVITLINSFFDPSWSSPGIFIISLYIFFANSFVGATLAVARRHGNLSAFGENLVSESQRNKKTQKTTVIAILSVFILLFLSSKTLSDYLYLKGKYHQSLTIDPFNLNSHLALIKNNQLHPLTLKLFPNDTIIYKQLISTIPLPQSQNYYYKLFELNPKENLQNYSQLAKYYQKNNQPYKLEKTLNLINQNFDKNQFGQNAIPLSILSYNVALNQWQMDQTETSIVYFQQAINNASQHWSQFHIELANAYWYNGQKEKALKQLLECQKLNHPKKQCLYYLKENNFKQPGFYKSIINKIEK